jgi:hypothetical protein
MLYAYPVLCVVRSGAAGLAGDDSSGEPGRYLNVLVGETDRRANEALKLSRRFAPRSLTPARYDALVEVVDRRSRGWTGLEDRDSSKIRGPHLKARYRAP